MKKGQLGLDELMIVNPGPPGPDAFFLGEDGTLYHVRGLEAEPEPQGTVEYFLGEDGTLYQVHRLGTNNPAEETAVNSLGGEQGRKLGRYFLGGDGSLYELPIADDRYRDRKH